MKQAALLPGVLVLLLSIFVTACGDSEGLIKENDGMSKKNVARFESEKYFESLRGFPTAQFNLGCCYRDGLGVAKNSAEAAKWFRKSADQGHAPAQNSLGLCYRDGEGVVKDPVEGAKWITKSAKQGHAYAQHNLAALYQDGVGVAKDQVEAYAYYNLASIVEEVSRKWRDKLEEKMSPEALLRGQQRTKELQKEIEAEKAGK